jgi:hypothetical protein
MKWTRNLLNPNISRDEQRLLNLEYKQACAEYEEWKFQEEGMAEERKSSPSTKLNLVVPDAALGRPNMDE